MAAAWDRWVQSWSLQTLSGILGEQVRRSTASLLAICLSLSLLLSACGSPAAPLNGTYLDDTMVVAEALLSTIAIADDDPSRAEAETSARTLVKDYVAFYRPRSKVNGLSSFTTMQTAINSLAGHYTNYPNRPLPEALKTRVAKELRKAEANVTRGA
ncbi:MAG: photosystem II protein Psb27 [Cyanobacteria bacterium]|nr:photosystem II protein Psb27 [Cyanobacteria bacterium bin.51]